MMHEMPGRVFEAWKAYWKVRQHEAEQARKKG